MVISRSKAERYILKKSIVFVGMMGAGKSLIGCELANYLNVAFFDSDIEIELAENTTVQEIFKREGEAFFREKEKQTIKRLMNQKNPIVLASGGGAFLTSESQYYISKNGFSIFLNVPIEVLQSRVMNDSTRPLLGPDCALNTFKDLWSDRLPVYLNADWEFTITEDILPSIMVDTIVNTLIERNIVTRQQ